MTDFIKENKIIKMSGGEMKKILFCFLIFLFISCSIPLPKKPPVVENLTYSLPIGDTLMTVLEVALDHPERISIKGDTVFGYTQREKWINAAHLNGKSDTIKISINIEELLPEEWIDTSRDSTYFTSTINKVHNFVRFWGKVPFTTGGRLIHRMYSSGRLIYLDTVEVFFNQRSFLDTLYTYSVDDFPIGDYYHEIEVQIDSGQTFVDSLEAYSMIAFQAKLTGDRVMTVVKEQTLPFAPPESSPLNMINWVRLNLDIWNRLPISSNFILLLYDSVGNIVFSDTFLLAQTPKDSIGRATGTGVYSNLNIDITHELDSLFRYSTFKFKGRFEIPAPTDIDVFVTPADFIRVKGALQMNMDFDPYFLPNGE